jgi:CubicO group peptidase (beta-lactamase class C family)
MLLLTCVGFSQKSAYSEKDKIKNARKIARKFFKTQKIPGMSISVSEKGELIWSEGFGYANRHPKVRIEPDETLFRIASISKSITAVIVAKLIDDKQIDIDKSIYKYLPDYPKKKYDFSVRELGGHLAGIRNYKGNEFILNKKMIT